MKLSRQKLLIKFFELEFLQVAKQSKVLIRGEYYVP